MDFKKLARIQDSADRKADDMKVSKVSPIGNDRSLKYVEDEDGTFYLSVEDKDGVVFGITVKNDLSAEGDDDLMERLQKTDFYPFKEKNDVMRAYRQIVKSYKKEDAIDDTVVKQSENSEQIIDSDVTTTAIVELGAQYLIGQVTYPEVKDDMVAYYHRGVTEDEPEFYLCFLLNEATYVFSVNGKEEERGGFVSVMDIDEIFKNTETILTEYLEKVQDSEDETKPKFRKKETVIVELPNYGQVEAEYVEHFGGKKHIVKYAVGSTEKQFAVNDDKIQKIKKGRKSRRGKEFYQKKLEDLKQELASLEDKLDQSYADMENDPEVLKDYDNGPAVQKYAEEQNKLQDKIEAVTEKIRECRQMMVQDSYKEETYTQEDLLNNKPAWAEDEELWKESVKEATKEGTREVRIAIPLALYKKSRVQDSDEEHFQELEKSINKHLGEGFILKKNGADDCDVINDGMRVAVIRMPENRIEDIEVLDESLKSKLDKVAKDFKKVEDSVRVIDSYYQPGDSANVAISDSYSVTIIQRVGDSYLAYDSTNAIALYKPTKEGLVELEDSVEQYEQENWIKDDAGIYRISAKKISDSIVIKFGRRK